MQLPAAQTISSVLSLLLSIGHAKEYEGGHGPCTNVSTYGPVVWEKSTNACCITKIMEPLCTTNTTNICVDLDEMVCEIETWTECTMKSCPVQVVKPVQMTEPYHPFTCKDDMVNITQTKEHYVPVEKTEELCDSIWITNDDGESVWGGYENCQNVTNTKYERQEINVTVLTRASKCTNSPMIEYLTCKNETETSEQMCTSCVARAAPRCELATRRECADVETKECKPQTVEECEWRSTVPGQKFKHSKRCLSGGRMKNTVVEQSVTNSIFDLREVSVDDDQDDLKDLEDNELEVVGGEEDSKQDVE